MEVAWNMDGPTLSQYPHYSWLGTRTTVETDGAVVSFRMRRVAHCLIHTIRERADVRWIHRGREQAFTVDAGFTIVSPADGEWHTLLERCRLGHDFFTLLIPEGHIRVLASDEGVTTDGTLRYSLQPKDPELSACLTRIGSVHPRNDSRDEQRHDEAARRLVLRLVQLSGGRAPDWLGDAGIFDHRTMSYLVEYIDAHLREAPSLGDLGMRVGLSPSHFAKKFRQSTGSSLHRFVNRRRIRASMEALREQSRPLAHIAFDLGFSSQAHFTDLFSTVTGMTPAKYRKQFKPVVG
jgi:AraC-like DNA-binding protein